MNKHNVFLHGFSQSNVLYIVVLQNCWSPLVGKNNHLIGRDVFYCSMVLDVETENKGNFQVLTDSLNMKSTQLKTIWK